MRRKRRRQKRGRGERCRERIVRGALRAPRHAIGNERRTLRVDAVTGIIGARVAGHEPRVQRKAHDEVQRSVDPEGVAPSHDVLQPLRQRPEHGARESTEERQRGDGPPIRVTRELMQRGERRIIEARGHRDAGKGPAGEERRVALRRSEDGKRRGTEQRSPRQHQ